MKVSALSLWVTKKHDLVVEPFAILLDGIDELGLVLLDGSTNLWDRKKNDTNVADFGLIPLGKQTERWTWRTP